MKLTKAQIKNYDRIADSEEMLLDEKLTVLIGKNEQGKTTFSKTLESFNKFLLGLYHGFNHIFEYSFLI